MMTCAPTVHLLDETRPGLTCPPLPGTLSHLHRHWCALVPAGARRRTCHGPSMAPRDLPPVAQRAAAHARAAALSHPIRATGRNSTMNTVTTIAPEVAAELAELDDLADTARTVHDINSRVLDAASEALGAARARFEAASAAWGDSGAALDATARKAAAARQAAGVSLTASGYRPAVTS